MTSTYEYRPLGSTGFKVSPICFGTLTLSPLQANLPLEKGADLLKEAYDLGINFWDTAESYYNYQYIKLALKKIKEPVVWATKTYAYTKEGARKALENARSSVDTDVVPIFMLHEQESRLTLEGHKPALDFLLEAKIKGQVNAVGISTHCVAAVKAILEFKELDVIHPIINYRGIGIKDGTLKEMLKAVKDAYDHGFGVYAMKVLGGGHLIPEARRAVNFAKALPYLHSFALGISNREELQASLCYVNDLELPKDVNNTLTGKKRVLKIEDWCVGCGRCVENCPQGALFLETNGQEKYARVDTSTCIFCGYCGVYCEEFCIKIF